ncbi:NUDIX hydrolase [Bacillus sp. NEB1478]|uniref:NUDIX hydrolase n=1 Tax=Bacillus sp. NEB1478 TaxID=3073816 RepID=UPI002873E739|nr:NUDIX hydrolase [Bacillus sp. NEB1478]WNB91025.1 NUDIX hydrolase [Bacillus sp. NEB1478]
MWKTISSKYQYKSPFGNLRIDTCQLPNGSVIDEYYVNEYSDWVNAVVITKDNKVVLVEQYRHAGNGFFLEVPAGKVEDNESHEEGILREIKEETGYISKEKPILLGEFWTNPATQTNKVATYLILDAFEAFNQTLDTYEEINVRLVDFDDMEEMIQNKQITQLFTVSAYYITKVFLSNKERINVK